MVGKGVLVCDMTSLRTWSIWFDQVEQVTLCGVVVFVLICNRSDLLPRRITLNSRWDEVEVKDNDRIRELEAMLLRVS